MSEIQVIQMTLERTARRHRWQRAWRGLWHGFLIGSALWLFVLGLYKLVPVPERVLEVAGGVAGLCVVGGFLVGGWRRLSLLHTARWVDDRQHLQERLSTALEIAPTPEAGRWRDLVLADAAGHARGFNARKLLPFSLPGVARWTAVVLAAAAGLGFVPEYRSKAYVQKKKEAEVIRETGRQLAELTRRQLAARPPALEPTQKALESVRDLGQQLAKAQLNRTQALRELASLTDRIKEQTRELGRNPALRKLDAAARTPTGPSAPTLENLQKQIESLQQELGKQAGNPQQIDQLKQDLQKIQQAVAGLSASDSSAAQAAKEQLSQALSDLARKAEELGLDLPGIEDAIKALEAGQIDRLLKDLKFAEVDLQKMAQMAKALKDLQMQLVELGKTLAEQLEKGQAFMAVATLNKMIDQLKAASLSEAQLKKILDEVDQAVAPGSEYGQVGDFLKQAVEGMRRGNKPGAAKSLADAADELKRLMNQLSDCQGLMAALDSLQTAQLCVGNCTGWGICKGCRPGFRPGGKPGRGVGTWGDDSLWMDAPDTGLWDNSGIQRPDLDPRGLADRGEGQLSDALTPTKVRGQISPGGPMPSITLKGVSIKGQSKVQYQEAVTAAQSDAQSALSQEQVPRAYQGAVRDYFDDLKE